MIKRLFILCAVAAFTLNSCDKEELTMLEKEFVKAQADNKNKKDSKKTEFDRFNDHYQIGAEWRN